MKEFRGIAACPGSAVAPALAFRDEGEWFIPSYSIESSELPAERERLALAMKKAKVEMALLRDRAGQEAGEEQAAIFDAQLLMLDDADLLDEIERRLASSLRNIERVLVDIEGELRQKLEASDDPGLRDRAMDIRDVSRRVLGHLLSRERRSLAELPGEVVIVARDLLPSDMISMDRSKVRAIVTEAGGRTSHVAILARAFEIPAVLGVSGIFSAVANGMTMAVDGQLGRIIVDPNPETLAFVSAARAEEEKLSGQLALLRDLPAESRDGGRLRLLANIEVPEEIQAVLRHGAEGVGLFRSEFLFLRPGRLPDEEEQYRAYRRVIEAMDGRPVTIRTLDVGGDKLFPPGTADVYEADKNPLLGWRALRFCLSHPEIFKTQLRAILRAAAAGPARIMFPMVASTGELDRALDFLEDAKRECRSRGQAIPDSVPTGIMIEIPSAAIASDLLAPKVNFFSLGTNDLIQYTLAVDRANPRLAYINEPYNPAVLRLVAMTIANGKAAGISVGMCGEMASDPQASALLMGLGLTEFSMSSVSIPAVKRAVRSTSAADAKALAEDVMRLSSSAEIEARLAAFAKS